MSFQISDLWSSGGTFDPVKAATSAAGAAAIYGAFKPDSTVGRFLGAGSTQRPVGYTGGIPEFGITRALLPDAFSTTTPTGEPRRPGSGGRRYFSDTTYTPTGETMSSGRLSPVNVPVQTRAPTTPTSTTPSGGLFDALPPEAIISLLQNLFGSGGISFGDGTTKQEYAAGGLTALPESRGFYLGGATDGMADEIPATIEETQPAALSDGEFVIPADVVSHLGNGNSDAGAKKLYDMMDRIREARTGNKEQGRRITPEKLMPV
jgi:hypothetical protein